MGHKSNLNTCSMSVVPCVAIAANLWNRRLGSMEIVYPRSEVMFSLCPMLMAFHVFSDIFVFFNLFNVSVPTRGAS